MKELDVFDFNLNNIVTPVKVDKLEQLLLQMKYDQKETEFVVNGFRYGFPLGYQGNRMRKTTSRNLKLRCGSEEILW